MSGKSFPRLFLQKLVHWLAQNCIHPGFRIYLYRTSGVTIGRQTFIGRDCFIDDQYPECIRIGDQVTISFRVTLVAHDDSRNIQTGLVSGFTRSDLTTVKSITIASGAYIGTGAIILPGVTVGEGAVVGAGAVVTKDVAAYSLVVGNPAKFVRSLASH